MLNPQLLTTFATIVSAGSISAAAVRLGCGKSVVSRQLARLEADQSAGQIQNFLERRRRLGIPGGRQTRRSAAVTQAAPEPLKPAEAGRGNGDRGIRGLPIGPFAMPTAIVDPPGGVPAGFQGE